MSKRVKILMGAVVCLCLAIAGGLGAQPVEAAMPTGSDPVVDDATRAQGVGISVTTEELRQQAGFRDVVERIRNEHADWLISAVWKSDRFTTPTILMRTDTPPEVRVAVASLGYSASYSVPYSAEQRVDLTQAIHQAVMALPEVVDATTVILPSDSTVYITAHVSTKLDVARVGSLVGRLTTSKLGFSLKQAITLVGESIGEAEYAGGEYYLGNGSPDLPLAPTAAPDLSW